MLKFETLQESLDSLAFLVFDLFGGHFAGLQKDE